MTDYARKKMTERYGNMKRVAREGYQIDKTSQRWRESNPNRWVNFDAEITRLLAYSDKARKEGEYQQSLDALRTAGNAVMKRQGYSDYQKERMMRAIEKRLQRIEYATIYKDEASAERAEAMEKNVRKSIENLHNKSKKTLEQKLTAITSILGIAGGIVFGGLGITGNVIGNSQIASGIGVCLFIAGIISAVFYYKSKKSNHQSRIA